MHTDGRTDGHTMKTVYPTVDSIHLADIMKSMCTSIFFYLGELTGVPRLRLTVSVDRTAAQSGNSHQGCQVDVEIPTQKPPGTGPKVAQLLWPLTDAKFSSGQGFKLA